MEIKKEECGFEASSLTKKQKIYFKSFFDTLMEFQFDTSTVSFNTYTFNGVCFSKNKNLWIVRFMQKDLVMFEDKFITVKKMLEYTLTEYFAENKLEEESLINYFRDTIDYYSKQSSNVNYR